LLLEPYANLISATNQKALHAAGIAVIAFGVDDVQAEYARLTQLGVMCTMEPTSMGPVISAVFDDTCGNLINTSQKEG